jgi:hypothetical protein
MKIGGTPDVLERDIEAQRVRRAPPEGRNCFAPYSVLREFLGRSGALLAQVSFFAIGKREFTFKPPDDRQLAAVSGAAQAFSLH